MRIPTGDVNRKNLNPSIMRLIFLMRLCVQLNVMKCGIWLSPNDSTARDTTKARKLVGNDFRNSLSYW